MKKYTKILALALAVAMMLGMTAMAGTPSKFIMSDDFAGYADIAAFNSASMAASAKPSASPYYSAAVANRSESDNGTIKYNRFYVGSGLTFATANGKNYIQTPNNTNSGFGYVLDTPFNYETAKTNKTALVAQVGWTMTGSGTGTVLDWADTFALIKKTDGTDFATSLRGLNRGYSTHTGTDGTVHDKTWFTANPNTVVLYAPSPGTTSNCGTTQYRDVISAGDDVLMQYVFRNGNNTQINRVEANSVNKPIMLSSINRNFEYATARWMPYVDASDVYGVYFESSDYAQGKYHDFLMYEVSIDPADFTFDSSAAVTGVLPNGNVELVFAMPITAEGNGDRTSENHHLSERIIITKGDDVENPLVYGEDFTFEISERVVGNAVKGVLTIKPLKDWGLGTTYDVYIRNLYNVARIEYGLEEEDGEVVVQSKPIEMTFTTIPAPVANFVAYEGLDDTGSTTSDYAGKTVYVKATATNSNNIGFNVKLIIGIYDEDGNLVKYASATKALAASGNATFGAAFKLAAGQTIRAEYK